MSLPGKPFRQYLLVRKDVGTDQDILHSTMWLIGVGNNVLMQWSVLSGAYCRGNSANALPIIDNDSTASRHKATALPNLGRFFPKVARIRIQPRKILPRSICLFIGAAISPCKHRYLVRCKLSSYVTVRIELYSIRSQLCGLKKGNMMPSDPQIYQQSVVGLLVVNDLV